MTWARMIEAIKAESGPDVAAKIEARLLRDLGGVRVSIPAKARPVLTTGAIQTALRQNGYAVDKAAAALGVHPTTLYRRLHTTRQQAQPAPPGTYRGRLVR